MEIDQVVSSDDRHDKTETPRTIHRHGKNNSLKDRKGGRYNLATPLQTNMDQNMGLENYLFL